MGRSQQRPIFLATQDAVPSLPAMAKTSAHELSGTSQRAEARMSRGSSEASLVLLAETTLAIHA
jgi:hypothetical protein